MAEEGLEKEAEDYFCDGCENSFEHENGHCSHCSKWDYFIAGAKAHHAQWHDLRKNPNDLPMGDIHRKILIKDKLNNLYTGCWFPKDDYHKEDCFSAEWLDYGFQGYNFCAKEQIIEWGEIPKFEE